MPRREDPLRDAVRRLRLALGDTQQEFANRLHLAISTVVRYELTRPPRGKALAQLERVATENGFDEYGLIFRNALREEFAGRQGHAGESVEYAGFVPDRPQTPEEEAMVFDVLKVMREAQDTRSPSNNAAQREKKLLLKATKRKREERIEAVEVALAESDHTKAILRLYKLGLPAAEIAERLKVSGHAVWTEHGRTSKVEAVIAEYNRERQAEERKSK